MKGASVSEQEGLELQAENAYYEGLTDAEVGDAEEVCWTCDGQRFVTVGVDIDCDDAIVGKSPFDGETIRCPNCHGSGKAADCWYW